MFVIDPTTLEQGWNQGEPEFKHIPCSYFKIYDFFFYIGERELFMHPNFL